MNFFYILGATALLLSATLPFTKSEEQHQTWKFMNYMFQMLGATSIFAGKFCYIEL